MANKKNLALIFGGRSGEHDVSLMSAQSVAAIIDQESFNVFQIGITRQGQWLYGKETLNAFLNKDFNSLLPVVLMPEPGNATLYSIQDGKFIPITQIDVIFPVMHGTFCEDGTLQGFLEMADIAYVGAGVTGSAVGMDKGIFKHVMKAIDIPVLPYVIINRLDIQQDSSAVVNQVEQIACYPLFTKPANLGSSVGIQKVNNREALIEGLREAARFDRRVIVEKGINAREIEVSVLGNEHPIVSVPGEVVPKDSFYTYKDKYLNGKAELLIPAPLTKEQTRYIQAYALRAYTEIDCAGMARVDFFIDRDTTEIYISEVNTIPGFTSISMYPKLWQATGISYADLVQRLINLALDRKSQRDQTVREFEG